MEEMNIFFFGLLPELLFVGLANYEFFGRTFQLAPKLPNEPAFHFHNNLDFSVNTIAPLANFVLLVEAV